MLELLLSRESLISLIRGKSPKSYEQIGEFSKLGIGEYVGGFADKWTWNNENSLSWNKFSKRELYKIYQKLK